MEAQGQRAEHQHGISGAAAARWLIGEGERTSRLEHNVYRARRLSAGQYVVPFRQIERALLGTCEDDSVRPSLGQAPT
eukprot:3726205-Prymnesium_polylepis.2